MNLVINISKEDYERFKKNQKKEYSESMLDVNIIANGTPLPDNATNRNVIEIMFPDGFSAKKSWWDAPFRMLP